MSNDLSWHDDAVVSGIRVRAHFFDPAELNKEEDFQKRNLPVFKAARPALIATESDRRNFKVGELIAQPDSVLSHGSGLISLEYKSHSGRSLSRQNWRLELKLKEILQSIIGAMAVSGETGKVTVPMLRCHNALLLLSPPNEVVEFIASTIPIAKAYYRENKYVSMSQLAKLCEIWVRETFHQKTKEEQASSDAGVLQHEHMLRRNRPATGGAPG